MLPESSGIAAKLFNRNFASVDARQSEVDDAEARLRDAERALVRELQHFALTATQEEIDAVAFDLLWAHQKIDSISIADALGYPSARQMTDTVGLFHTGLHCARCESEIVRRPLPGAWQFDLPGFDGPVCRECRNEVASERGHRPRF